MAFSFIMGILVTAFFIMLPNGFSRNWFRSIKKCLGSYFEIWYPMHGLHQRILLGLYFIWLLVFSYLVKLPSLTNG